MPTFDQARLLADLQKRIKPGEHPSFAHQLPALFQQIIELDMAYMYASGFLSTEGEPGDGLYDEDDALESILDRLAVTRGLSPDQEADLAFLLDQYYEIQRGYLDDMG